MGASIGGARIVVIDLAEDQSVGRMVASVSEMRCRYLGAGPCVPPTYHALLLEVFVVQRFAITRLALASSVVLCGAAVAAEQATRDHDIEPEDYFSIGVMSQCAVSADGGQIAYTETRWQPPDEKRNTDLWVVDAATKTVRRLTFDPAGDNLPQWSADGRYIYFTSSRKRGEEKLPPYNGKKQVWRIDPDGGQPQPVTRLKDGIGSYDLSADGTALYYTTSKEETDEDWKELREEFKDLKYGHGVTKFSRVWKLDLRSWRARELVDDKRVIVSFKVAPDQSRIAMITRPDETLLTNEGWSRVDIYDAATKTVSSATPESWRNEHPSPYGWLDSVSWSGDSQALAFTVSFDGYPPMLYVADRFEDGPRLRELRRPAGVSITGGTVTWRGTSRDVCFLGEERARARVYCVADDGRTGSGEHRTLTPGDVVAKGFDFAPSGSPLAVILGTTTHTPDLFLAATMGDGSRRVLQRMTTINPQMDSWKLPQISLVRWIGADGDEVEGVLELPPDYKPGAPLPMVVEIHGGPTAASQYRLRFWIYGRTLLAAKGYAVLSPNYRGSTGYGDKFMTDLVGRENDIEVEDILNGVEAMIERGIADPERIGVMGWSNGGYLTNCLITRSDRFRAASSGAGVLDMVIQWGTEDTPGHVINFMKKLPWDDAKAYRDGSPMYNLGKVNTPTLIHVGENDPRVPPAHSRALYRALRHYLHVPAELVVYPDEGHGLTKYTHRKAKMQWDLAWFDRYLLGKSTESAGQADSETSSTH